MKSTIRIDVNEASHPVITIVPQPYETTDDLRDKIVERFISSFQIPFQDKKKISKLCFLEKNREGIVTIIPIVPCTEQVLCFLEPDQKLRVIMECFKSLDQTERFTAFQDIEKFHVETKEG